MIYNSIPRNFIGKIPRKYYVDELPILNLVNMQICAKTTQVPRKLHLPKHIKRAKKSTVAGFCQLHRGVVFKINTDQ